MNTHTKIQYLKQPGNWWTPFSDKCLEHWKYRICKHHWPVIPVGYVPPVSLPHISFCPQLLPSSSATQDFSYISAMTFKLTYPHLPSPWHCTSHRAVNLISLKQNFKLGIWGWSAAFPLWSFLLTLLCLYHDFPSKKMTRCLSEHHPNHCSCHSVAPNASSPVSTY